LLGATVIVTGLSPEIAQTLVTIGVDLSEMATVGDLQGGIEEAERLLGYKVLPLEEVTPKACTGPVVRRRRARGSPDPEAGPLPDRVHPVGAHRRRSVAAAR